MNTKIMIIDAHPVYVPQVVDFLTSMGLTDTMVVSCGQKAIEAIAKENPTCVILSAILPDIDSLELAGQIKSQYPAIAIMVQTGLLTSQQTIERFKALEVDHVIARRSKDWTLFKDTLEQMTSARQG